VGLLVSVGCRGSRKPNPRRGGKPTQQGVGLVLGGIGGTKEIKKKEVATQQNVGEKRKNNNKNTKKKKKQMF